MDIEIVDNQKNVMYMCGKINEAAALLDTEVLDVRGVTISSAINGRGQWSDFNRVVYMNPHARCFWPDYRGYRYKTFGGQKDLTPGGVFLHECGHAFAFRNHQIIREFRKLRQMHPQSISVYGSGNVYEDIAECFRLYVSNPALLKSVVPERFTVIDRYARKYIHD